ncbi:hypothetical protein [Saccharopolyspora hattusasensis]|uniref:hypothetical protein n=1 Tax=Saccharopolyspora hattusasensis TaxID=1128679 RepID=UPI003D97F4DE
MSETDLDTPDYIEPQTTEPDDTAAEAQPDYKALYEKTEAQLRRWEARAKENRDKARKLDELEEAGRSETEKLQRQAQELAASRDAAIRRAVEAEIRAAASGWAHPADAPRFLDDTARYLTDNGDIDTTAIRTDLDTVLAERPYLARDERRRPAPDAGQGARPDGSPGVDSRIAEAQQSGNWRESLALKTQQAIDLNRPA